MKHSKAIQKSLHIAALVLATGWAQNLAAFNYTNTNLLLVFRKDGKKDVEFNIGSVTNYLGKSNGISIQVTNWNVGLVRTNFDATNTFATVKFLLMAVTSSTDPLRRAWLTDATAGDTPLDVTGSRWTQIYSKVSAVGDQAAAATFTNSTQTYVTNSSEPTAFSYIASGGGQLDASTLGGASPFPLESEVPATNRFIELKVSSATPKPAAAVIGTFSLTAAGVLTFTAGPPEVALTPSHIESITRAGSLNTITFTTVSGANYRLRSTTTLVPNASTWTIVPGTVAGDGSNKTLTDTTTDTQRFYAVEAFR
jgi:hypothetical protein